LPSGELLLKDDAPTAGDRPILPQIAPRQQK
jgi:hypothetical protein